MFDYVEQISGRTVGGATPTPTPGKSQSYMAAEESKQKRQQDRQRQELEKQAKRLQENDDLDRVEQMQYGEEDNEDDM